MMQFRQLGRTGLSVSAVGFGCGSVGGLFVRGTPRAQRRAVEIAVEGGVNYFDTAAQYGEGRSEENLGKVLRELRLSVLVGTKFGITQDELADVRGVARSKLEDSLRRLGLERVDVVTLHSMLGAGAGSLGAPQVIGPVAAAMRELVEAGLASAIGFTGLGETEDILEVTRSGLFDTFQCYFNVLNPSASLPGSPDGMAQDFRGVLNIASETGLGAFCIRALAGGALGGRDERHEYSSAPRSTMAEGEEYVDDLQRGRAIASHLRDFQVGSLPELAFRYALSEGRLASILVGFSDEADVQEVLAWEASGELPEASLRALRASEAD